MTLVWPEGNGFPFGADGAGNYMLLHVPPLGVRHIRPQKLLQVHQPGAELRIKDVLPRVFLDVLDSAGGFHRQWL